MLAPRSHRVRTNSTPRAVNVIEFTTIRTKRCISWPRLGPRYFEQVSNAIRCRSARAWAPYARHVPITPDDGNSEEEKIFKVGHGEDGVENEADEMWKGKVRDAIGRPWTMMVHLGNASSPRSAINRSRRRRFCSPLASLAMMCSWRLHSFTLPAPPPSRR